MSKVKVNGLDFYYELHGSGNPLVVINGLGTDTSDFRLITDIFAQHHQVLIFDNRGAGRSDKPDEPYSIKQMSNDTVAVMKNAGIERADILGISMGGRIALHLTLTHPEMVNKLVLTSTSARTVKTGLLRRLITFAILPRLPIFKGKYPQPYSVFKRQRQASRTYDCSQRIKGIHKPVLITHGRSDKTTPVELAYELRDGIKGSQLQLLKGGHMSFLLWDRQRYLNEVENFLSS